MRKSEVQNSMIEFIDETPEQDGTELNRANLMALQGFIAVTIVRNADGSYTETNSKGQTLVTKKREDGSIEQTFTGEKTIKLITKMNEDYSILTEVIE